MELMGRVNGLSRHKKGSAKGCANLFHDPIDPVSWEPGVQGQRQRALAGPAKKPTQQAGEAVGYGEPRCGRAKGKGRLCVSAGLDTYAPPATAKRPEG